MRKILTAAQMQTIDKRAIEEYGIPGMILMENAGRGAVDFLKGRFPGLGSKKVVVFAGKGNNGGDGFVMARHLLNLGAEVRVLLVGKISELKADARRNLEIALKIGVEINEVDAGNFKSFDHRLRHSDLIVDAIFGTGLSQPAVGFFAEVFEAVNQLRKFVVSVDIPSGVDSDSGRLTGPHIEADLTLALAALKRSHVIFPAAQVMGDVEVIDIGVPLKAWDSGSQPLQMTEPGDVAAWFRRRSRNAHKGDFGHALVVAGSLGKGGAAGLAALGALRAGGGLTTLALPESCWKAVEFNPLEVMTVPLPETKNGTLALKAKDPLMEQIQGKSVVAVGPGVSTDPETVQLLKEFLPAVRLPLVLDADALNCLALSGGLDCLKSPEVILTPHPKEMSRISGLSVQEIQENRVETARRFAMENSVSLELKGARSIMAFADGSVFINPTGNPGMATAGSGDVLTGIIAGLISQGLKIDRAVIAGTYLHGLAGDIYCEKNLEASMIAGDLLDNLPESMRRISARRPRRREYDSLH